MWFLAIGLLAADVLVARWIVLEYRRYRVRRLLAVLQEQLVTYRILIGEAFIPAVQDAAYAVQQLARHLSNDDER